MSKVSKRQMVDSIIIWTNENILREDLIEKYLFKGQSNNFEYVQFGVRLGLMTNEKILCMRKPNVFGYNKEKIVRT